jgi:glycerol-3-phosphate cytidylyltransferase
VRPYHTLEYVSGCRELDADIFVIGEDWGHSPHNIAVEDYLKSQGKQIIQIKYDARTSSTIIKNTVVDQSRGSFPSARVQLVGSSENQ